MDRPLTVREKLVLTVTRRWRGSGFWFGLAITLLWPVFMFGTRISFRGGEHALHDAAQLARERRPLGPLQAVPDADGDEYGGADGLGHGCPDVAGQSDADAESREGRSAVLGVWEQLG